MIGPWEILLAFNRNPKDEGIDLGKNVACAIAQDIEKICADYEAQRVALAAAEKALKPYAELHERLTKIGTPEGREKSKDIFPGVLNVEKAYEALTQIREVKE